VKTTDRKICVVGLGYVGLPLAVAFGKKQHVLGFDVNNSRIESLKKGIDLTNETSFDDLKEADILFTTDPVKIKEYDFIIIAVPTPVNDARIPDLTAVRSASATVGANLSANSIVVYESTVYPGVTEDICMPILEDQSGLKCGVDFKIGYSPERINPGDKEHTINKIVKIVSGMDDETLQIVADVYSQIIDVGVFKASNIKTAEAAKVIENIQRDLNIALMNELSIVFNKIGIETREVVEAACTKWNFNRYLPGLVGGHCIGVDPYYMTHLAIHLGIHPKVILAGRDTNDGMSKYVVERVIIELNKVGRVFKESKVLVMGLTFKQNVPDIRNSRAFDVIRHLRDFSVNVIGCDPLLDEGIISMSGQKILNMPFDEIDEFDCALVINGHNEFNNITLDVLKSKMKPNPIIIDIQSFYSKTEALEKGFAYFNL